MIDALDSSFDRPTAAQVAQAKAAGIGWWFGYLATQQAPGSFNLASPWDRASFQVVQDGGLRAGAFCSGWDDPAALRQLATEWGLVCLLDHEWAIRPDGPWVQPWLDASGFGLYAVLSLQGYRAPCRIAAEYPVDGCTGATWPTSPAPSEPHGWQCQGTHTEFGLSVDRSVLDDRFGGETMDAQQAQQLLDLWTQLTQPYANDVDPAGNPISAAWGISYANTGVQALQKVVATLASGSLTPELDARLQALEAAVGRIEKALQAA